MNPPDPVFTSFHFGTTIFSGGMTTTLPGIKQIMNTKSSRRPKKCKVVGHHILLYFSFTLAIFVRLISLRSHRVTTGLGFHTRGIFIP
jgi:hypothetical protein